MMNEAKIYGAVVELQLTLEKQTEMQQLTIRTLDYLTKTLLHTASSIDKLNAELKPEE